MPEFRSLLWQNWLISKSMEPALVPIDAMIIQYLDESSGKRKPNHLHRLLRPHLIVIRISLQLEVMHA